MEKTQTQKTIAKLRNRYILFYFLEYLFMFMPYVIIMIVRHETYFTQKNGVSMGIGCIICLIVACIIASRKVKHLNAIAVFAVGGLIAFLMDTILQDLTIILWAGGAGYAVSLIFDKLAVKYKEAYKAFYSANITKMVMKDE